MEYRAIYTGQEDLEHGLFGRKGSQKKNHKYLMREWVNNKWKYYYTQAQIQAKNAGKKISDTFKPKKKSLGSQFKDTAKNIGKSLTDPKNGIDPKKVKKKIDKAINKLGKTTFAKKLMGKSTEKSSLATKGKNVVDNLFKEKRNENMLSGFGVGLTNRSYAKSFGKLAVKDLVKGKFKKAANEASAAIDYLTSDSNSLRIKKNKGVDKVALELRGEDPYYSDGYVSFDEMARLMSKKKK